MLVLTNNPLVSLKLAGQQHTVSYQPVGFRALLVHARDMVHQGYVLLTHPLSGSVKPNETIYKSMGMEEKPQQTLCVESLLLIEEAIIAHDRFASRGIPITPQMDADMQLIDWTLFQSALHSAPGKQW